MLVKLGLCQLELVQGDITKQQVDAVVNAANILLSVGNGVNAAIHQAGGPEILQETARLFPGGCPVGSAVVTSAGQLSARWVFHAVGPVWLGGKSSEPEQLASACRACLFHAKDLGCSSIAFPALSTGASMYPLDLAANNLIKTTMDFVRWHQAPKLVRFVLFDARAWGAFARAVEEVVP